VAVGVSFRLRRLKDSDGSWAELIAQWKELCTRYGEDFDDFNVGTISILQEVCQAQPPNPNQGAYGLVGPDGVYHGVCFLNLTLQKGYDGMVLRVLNLLLSPYYDFEDLDIEDYSEVLSAYFVNLIVCSNGELKSQHIKLHYRSPFDRQFFAVIAPHLSGVGQLATVESKGMWLSITKK
jgi:hypothetical protein